MEIRLDQIQFIHNIQERLKVNHSYPWQLTTKRRKYMLFTSQLGTKTCLGIT